MVNEILVLYYTQAGATKELAQLIARGIESVPNVSARLRTVPDVTIGAKLNQSTLTHNTDPYVCLDDLDECIGLALGSPVQFGNMASALKYFWDSTSGCWLAGNLIGKPATVFTSGSSLHGGQESCLLSMMLPLLHHGMLIMGIAYTQSELLSTTSGGTPYGVSHVAGLESNQAISKEEKALALATGKRLAQLALKLVNN